MRINFSVLCSFFIVFFQAAITNAQVNVNDSLVLVEFYNNTNGPGWNNHTNWLTTNPVRTWHGITVANNRVTGIRFFANNIRGPLPSSLGILNQLEILEITWDHLSGNLPPEIGNLSNLRSLSLESNDLTGNIPQTYGNLTNLQGFGVQINKLSGAIPISLGNLNPTVYTFVNENKFTFEGLEPLVTHFNYFQYGQQADVDLHFINGKLSVSAGGTLSNNTYTWFRNGTQVASITGDSAYTPTIPGNYSVNISNSIAVNLLLRSRIFQLTTLPIAFLDFAIQEVQDKARLIWKTSSEQNSSHFIIERSVNSVDFISIGRVEATGSSNTIKEYQFEDKYISSFQNQNIYYRILEYDRDEKVTYSKVITLKIAVKKNTISLQPNPVYDILKIRVGNYTGMVKTNLYNSSGRQVMNFNLPAFNGETRSINLISLANGCYYAVITAGDYFYAQKILKQ